MFAVTQVILIPQGDFVTYGALHGRKVARALAANIALPCTVLALTFWAARRHAPIPLAIALSLVIAAASSTKARAI